MNCQDEFLELLCENILNEHIFREPVKQPIPSNYYVIGKVSTNGTVEAFLTDDFSMTHEDFPFKRIKKDEGRFRIKQNVIMWWERPTKIQKEEANYIFPGMTNKILTTNTGSPWFDSDFDPNSSDRNFNPNRYAY